jgi:hypothetical protein
MSWQPTRTPDGAVSLPGEAAAFCNFKRKKPIIGSAY